MTPAPPAAAIGKAPALSFLVLAAGLQRPPKDPHVTRRVGVPAFLLLAGPLSCQGCSDRLTELLEAPGSLSKAGRFEAARRLFSEAWNENQRVGAEIKTMRSDDARPTPPRARSKKPASRLNFSGIKPI